MYISYIKAVMGIVKISDLMHEDLRVASNALGRSINAQAEHWMRVGMLAELYPHLDHTAICHLLIQVERTGGFDLEKISAQLASSSAVAAAASVGVTQ